MACRRRLEERFAFTSAHQNRRRRPALEVLEGRALLSTFTVNSLGDAGSGASGSGDLRYCINQANANDQANTIDFDPTVFSTPQTIKLSGRQLELADTGGKQTITGPAAAVTISGGGNSRVFQVDGGVTASISGLTISGGSPASGAGGGLANGGTVTLTDCTLSGNTAFTSGGGVSNIGTATLTGCTLSGNNVHAVGGGGGGMSNGGTAYLTDCTVSGNSVSDGSGGGVYNTFGTAYLTACTISGNSATDGGGLANYVNNWYSYEGPAILKDTIVAGNTDPWAGVSDIYGGNVSGSDNLIGIGGSAGLANGESGNVVLTSLTGLGLGSLASNGGPTQTMALLTGSAAINAGVIADDPGTSTPITTDQRGDPLDSPSPDIGAYQTQTHGSTLINLSFSGISDQTITYGSSSVTLSGTLSDGLQAPVGENVAVTLGGVEQPAAVGSGGAFSTTFVATGLSAAGSPYKVSYAYSSDGTFASVATSSSLTVIPAGTTTGLSASPTTATAGQSVTFTATIAVIAPGSGAPAGSVQFFVGSTSLGTASLSGNTATLATTALPAGTDSLTAEYLGDPDLAASFSNAVSVTIKPVLIATTTTLTSSPSPSVFGQSVTLTATVTPSSGTGTPTGTVTFYAGSTPLGSATLASNKATLMTTAIPVGAQAMTAVYSGNAADAPSTSLVLKQTVNPDSTTTTVSSSNMRSVYGQAVTFTAIVKAAAPGSGTPTGTVTFRNGTTTLGTAALKGGEASFTITTLPIGSDSITVVYGGDGNFKTSTSAALKQTVKQAAGTPRAASMGPSAVDQVLAVVQAERAQEVLVGDLAFEQLSSTKPWKK
jgi:hypothetical protein